MKQMFTFWLAFLTCYLSTAQVILTGNPIVVENALPGNHISEWGVPDFRDNRIAGFSTKMSLNSGETVRFKIDVQGGANYSLKIYRIGYYSGNGARLIHNAGSLAGTDQPEPLYNEETGMIDCDNWSESYSWAIPSSAVSGMYIARIERVGGGSNHILFIVRNDSHNSDIYVQLPDATWQAYNAYGGSSLYDGNTTYDQGHATKVSYNRPFFPYNVLFNTDGRGADWYMNAEYPMIRWLERNGYDITYTSCNDVARNGYKLLNHKIFLSTGHDEYWSKSMRDNIEAARDAGVHLAFFSGNEVYWKTRWEQTVDDEDRVLVCYKEGNLASGAQGERSCGFKCDDTSPEWTGLWRTGENYDAGKPENSLTGQISWTESPQDGSIKVPAFYKKHRFWRHTTIPNMQDGQTTTLASGTLGYEWDYEQEQFKDYYPKGRMTLSSTTYGPLTHKLSLYRHPGGALVFGAGTIQWAWGLDGKHWGGTPEINKNMQQATVNLFADMGVQPGSLQSNLVAASPSTDNIAPTSIITAPASGSGFAARAPVTISGTATDAQVVAGVEVSTDGGATWKVAELDKLDGNVTWTYTWIPSAIGVLDVKCRAFDDTGNMEIPGTGISITIGNPGFPFTIFEPTSKPLLHFWDPPINLGVRFKPNIDGFVTGVRFYKGPNNDGTHIGNLWSSDGQKLAEVTFIDETEEGWQQAMFSTPVPVVAGTVYTASYFSPTGNFSIDPQFFATAGYPEGSPGIWPVQALSNPDGGNGVYAYDVGPAFPSSVYNPANYFVDIIFTNTIAAATTLNGTVTLQGRPAAPHSAWEVPLTVEFFIPGNTTPAYVYNVITDQNGSFTVSDIPAGNFHIAVKNLHTLKRVKTGQTIAAGVNSIDFGELLEGDVNNDNFVTLPDLVSLLSTYIKTVGDPGYLPAADLNNDDFVTISDLLLLLGNYIKQGENP